MITAGCTGFLRDRDAGLVIKTEQRCHCAHSNRHRLLHCFAAQPKQARSITGASERSGERAGERSGERAGERTGAGAGERGGERAGAAAGARGGAGGRAANITTEQRTQIRSTLLRSGSVNRVSNLNVHVAIGTALPRDVVIRPLPPEIVTLVPEYRGYDYVVYNDEIIIIEPSTREIVYIIQG